MKTYSLWIITLITLLGSLISCDHTGKQLPLFKTSVQSDSTAAHSNIHAEDSGDVSPGMLFMTLIGFAFMLFCLGFGIAVTIVAMVFVFGLISLGIVSASVLVGVNQRSISKGFKTFFILAFSTIFLFIGAACGWILNFFMEWWTVTTSLIYGSITGLIGGIFVGFAAYYVVRGMIRMYTKKLAGKVGNAKGWKPKV